MPDFTASEDVGLRHTYYNCSYQEETTGKLVVANKRGYTGLRISQKRIRVNTKVAGARKEGWTIFEQTKATEADEKDALSQHACQTTRSAIKDTEDGPAKRSFFRRAFRRLNPELQPPDDSLDCTRQANLFLKSSTCDCATKRYKGDQGRNAS